jgi:ribonucleoside-diphosphate reductase alpha subunit
MIRGIAENAFLSKWAGGLGGSWTAVRGTGGYIQGTNGESQGIIPFLKLHNDQLVAVNQGGKRRGSGCAYLETWHNDIEDFLELRKNTGDERRRCHDMNTANWIPDLFMKRMEERQNWTLFRANETPDLHDLYGKAFEQRYCEYEAMAAEGKIWSRQFPALELWKSMLKMVFETGHPWITFKDPCNVRSPQDHCGVIHSSNLCTEITLNTSAEETAVCNLGSVVLDSHITRDGAIDHEMLKETITVAIRALDNVIDINFYPTEAAKTANSRHRPIGLGVMGLQNALYKRNLAFASDAAVEFNDEFMEAIAYYAYSASSDLAAEVGTYSSYKGSKWDRGLLPQDTVDLLETNAAAPSTSPAAARWTGPSSARKSPNTACATPTSSPSPPPPPSPTSWAPPPASSRTTRTSTSNPTSPATSSSSTASSSRTSRRPASGTRKCSTNSSTSTANSTPSTTSRKPSSSSTRPSSASATNTSSTPPPAARSGSTNPNPSTSSSPPRT